MDFKCTLGAFCYLQMKSFLEIDIFENLYFMYIYIYMYLMLGGIGGRRRRG